jgi:RHH-type proline utilization regulon transcriptional repressor/proline dehydrogenase/delta 1-pyrroline-5-carboxylate dehydrogenase
MAQLREQQTLEQRSQVHGAHLLAAARAQVADVSLAGKWVQGLLARLNGDPAFRIQALRFIDVLPSLDDDAELVRVFDEYFDADEFPLPRAGELAVQAGKLLGRHALAGVIRHAAATLSRQFLAGQDADSVFERVAELEGRGRRVSLDRVGEVILSENEAERYLQGYLGLLDASRARAGAPLHLSVKLSSLYSRIAAHRLEHGRERVLARLLTLSRAARDAGASITLDMEDFDTRPLTLAVFERWVTHPEFADWDGVGIALQAYLRDAADDVAFVLDLTGRRAAPFTVRLVRGAYWDQECIRALQHGWPIPVWRRQAQTDRTYEDCAVRLIGAHPRIRCAVATHNPRSMAFAMACAERDGLDPAALEFQLLYGMAESLQGALQSLGHPVRVYLPFGEPIPGMAYLVRRLLENSSSQSLARLSLLDEQDDAQLLRAPPLEDDSASDGADDVTGAAFVNEAPRRFVEGAERDAFAAAIGLVRERLGGDYPALVDGVESTQSARIRSTCPAQPDLEVGSVTACGRTEADHALEVAQRAFPDWRDRPVEDRAGLLRAAAHRLRTARDEFAAWQIFEAGKTWTEADADVCEAIDFLMFYADEAERLAGDRGVSVPGEHNRCLYQPRGIGVVIPPWNFPLAILTGMLSATLASGNCAILKPASDTPVIAARFVRLLLDAGLPPGVVSFLPGAGAEVGDYLVGHPDVHLVAFTGSREVGCRLLQRAAELAPGQDHVKRVIAEMGGKNAIIVDASADPDEAASGILQSAFGYQGQKCSACSRVIVVGDLYAGLVERLAAAAGDLVMELPWLPHADMGPVINRAAQKRIDETVAAAQAWGRQVYRGRVPDGLLGSYVAPAIFDNVDPASPLARDEIFGPVLAVMPARDFDAALAIANSTDYALTGGVYSRSPARLRVAAERFRVGNLYLNRGITGALVGRQPFGGLKLSGVGSKAGGPDYLLQFMEPRCITENTMRRGVAPW